MAHLYTVLLEDEVEESRLARYRSLLSPDETARGARYVFERNRHEHVVAHALKRLALSRHAPGVAPAEWRFEVGEYGKPEVAWPEGSGLRFNLSHTEGLVACIVADGVDVGCDVETTQRNTDTAAVAHRFFAAPEVAELRALPAGAQHERFFEYWTLKESYIKARGLGLAIPLGDFWFTLGGPGAAPVIGFAERLGDDPRRWAFFQGVVPPRWRMAAAVERRGGVEPVLVWRRGMDSV